jgi:hypothetical protein
MPTHLTIPAIGMNDSPIAPVGVEKVKQADGTTALRWQALDSKIGYQPTDLGEACSFGLVTLNGHNWWQYKAGVLVNLNKLKPGQPIKVTTDKGITCEYTVEWSKQYPPLETSWLVDTAAVGDPAKAYLNIYTCSTDFKERYVVRASLPIKSATTAGSASTP